MGENEMEEERRQREFVEANHRSVTCALSLALRYMCEKSVWKSGYKVRTIYEPCVYVRTTVTRCTEAAAHSLLARKPQLNN